MAVALAVDGVHPTSFLQCGEECLSSLCALLQLVENQVAWPAQIALLLYALLPKPDH